MLWNTDKWNCVSKTCEMWKHTHENILDLEKNVIKFVSYLKSHITLDLHTTIFKHSSVASDCGISFLPKCTGEDRENSGKLDWDV